MGILVFIVAALGWHLRDERATIIQQQSEIVQLTAKIADKSARENLELQDKCASQADKVFRQLGYSLSKDMASNQSHFNVKMNKCFMSFSVLTGGSLSKYLIDAFEQRGYAEFHSIYAIGREIPHCSLTPIGASATTCASESEYTTFVAQYME